MVMKKALVVGCNYLKEDGTWDLQGCCNDAVLMRKILVDYYGFEEANITTLLDKTVDGLDSEEPTNAKIRECLNTLIDGTESGDILVFFFAGHGASMKAKEGDNDETGMDEYIVPVDQGNMITDEDFQLIVSRIPEGVNFTFISDSCCSGGLIDELTVQIGGPEQTENVEDKKAQWQRLVEQPSGVRGYTKSRLLDSLNNDENCTEAVDFNNLWNVLNEKFGEEASPSIKRRCGGTERVSATKRDDVGILLSGCEAWEFSSDLSYDEQPQGKFTKTIAAALKELRSQGEKSPTNKEIIMKTRCKIENEFDPEWDKPEVQHPCLYCSDTNADATFICDFIEVEC